MMSQPPAITLAAPNAPAVLAHMELAAGEIEIVEWQWPTAIDFTVAEPRLMIEMSLPPFANDASASFPSLAPHQSCFMGTLFLRYPDVPIRARAEGGHIRVLRCIFAESVAERVLALLDAPPLSLLQAMLNIRNETVRTLMRLVLREVENPSHGSERAAEALMTLLEIEIRRLIEQAPRPKTAGRLAPWQYRRIRERLESGGLRPSVQELATLCGISVRHLHRQFLSLTGLSISDYVETHYISRSKAMLLTTNLPIRQISESLGFEHANSFSRAFRRITGTTPLQFRQSNGGAVTHADAAATS